MPTPAAWTGVHTEDLVPAPAFQSARIPELEISIRLKGLRRQLALERLAVFGVRGLLGGAAALAALSVAVWYGAPVISLWLAAAPVLAALAFGVVRWPSRLEAAKAADRRLGLDERLSTASELIATGQQGRLDLLQIRDAAAQPLSRAPLLFTRRTGYEAVAASVAVAAAIACALLLPRLPRVSPPTEPETSAVDVSAPDALDQPSVPADEPVAASVTIQPTAVAVAQADLANRVQQEQAEGSALEKLAQGLSNVSAGQTAANDLQQGNFPGAADELRNLGENADQLSEAAKQQLAQGLQQAASGSAQADPALANREQQAAQALTRSSYADQRQALRSLADQVERSGSRSVSSDQLARDLGQLQQQGQGSNPTSAGSATGQSGQNGQGSASGQNGQNGPGGGEEGGPGVGTGANPNPYSDQPTRLDSTGQRVEVPLKLGQGSGVRPSDGNEDGSAGDPSLNGRSVSELLESQQTGEVAPEQNLVPGEQRPVVRGYFR